MRRFVRNRYGRFLVLSLMLCLIPAGVTGMPAMAQAPYDLCVDDAGLAAFDSDGDGVLTPAELQEAAGQNSGNQQLQDVLADVDEQESIGVRYDGQCKEQRTPGALGTPAPGEVCSPNSLLALADANNDGVISIEEINAIIELVGGNEDLEDVRDRAVERGITGIRYRDCDPGTPSASPAATPMNATPAASPGSTPLASGIGSDESAGGEGGRGGATRPVLLALAGGSVLLTGALSLRVFRNG